METSEPENSLQKLKSKPDEIENPAQNGAENKSAEAKKPTGQIVLFLILSLAGQYLFKLGMDDPVSSGYVGSMAQNFSDLLHGSFMSALYMCGYGLALMFRPIVFAGLVAYALSAICWLSVLSKVDLSFAYPLISLGYVVILLMGWLCFGEEVTWLRWFGVILISMGIVAVYAEKFFVRWGSLMALLLFAAALCVITWAKADLAWQSDTPIPVLLLVVTIPMGIVGQILFKAGMNKDFNKERVSVIAEGVKNLKQEFAKAFKAIFCKSAALCFSPLILAGFAVYLLSTVLWLVLLTKMPLSFLYPLLSFGYVLVLLIGKFGFKEDVTFMRWYGVALICFGIVFIYSEIMICTYRVYAAAVLDILALTALLVSVWDRLVSFFCPALKEKK
ncbi:EamA family transporter [bacterium]|nr:EamA family transporter [bacterium]